MFILKKVNFEGFINCYGKKSVYGDNFIKVIMVEIDY